MGKTDSTWRQNQGNQAKHTEPKPKCGLQTDKNGGWNPKVSEGLPLFSLFKVHLDFGRQESLSLSFPGSGVICMWDTWSPLSRKVRNSHERLKSRHETWQLLSSKIQWKEKHTERTESGAKHTKKGDKTSLLTFSCCSHIQFCDFFFFLWI